MKNSRIHYRECVRFCLVSVHFIIMLITLTVLMATAPVVAYAAPPQGHLTSENFINYMMEPDSLELSGKIVAVREWGSQNSNGFNMEMFEPVVVRVTIKSQDGGCLGEHDFYIKKGISTAGIKNGAVIGFMINKNMCHPDKALIIMNMHIIDSGEKDGNT